MLNKRIFRDAMVLFCFCGAFAALLYFAGALEADNEPDIAEFSADRIRADRSFYLKDWEGARASLAIILERDPFDGRARFAYANSYYKERGIALDLLRESDLDPESDEYQQMQQRVKELEQLAADELIKSSQHARYRGRSLMYLAVLEAEREQFEQATSYLKQFVEHGNYSPDGLPSYQIFGIGGPGKTAPGAEVDSNTRLHAMPEFWDVVRREHENRMND